MPGEPALRCRPRSPRLPRSSWAPCSCGPTCSPSSPSSPGRRRATSARWRMLGFLAWGFAVAFAAEYASTRVGRSVRPVPLHGRRRGASSSTSRTCRSSTRCRFRSSPMPPSASRGGSLGPAGRGRSPCSPGSPMMLLDVVIDPLAVRGDRWFLGRIFYYPEAGVYFGVPLSNFAGWLIVGWVTVGGYLAVTGKADRPGRPALGVGLYYGVLLFNLAITCWIGEMGLLGMGILIHSATFLLLYIAVDAAQIPSGVGGRKRSLMSVPVSQMWTVASYVIKQKLAGRKQYPLVLMLEPLFRCNLACAGCGKIQYPAPDPQEAPHRGAVPQGRRGVRRPDRAASRAASRSCIPRSTGSWRSWSQRKKYIYLCTNAILLKEKLDLFTPSKYLTFSIHMDGLREEHDEAVCRDGVYDQAVEGIRGGARPRLPRHDEHDAVRRRSPRADAAVLRRDDGARRRGDDGLPRLQLLEGARPGALPAPHPDASALPAMLASPKKRLAVQPVAAVPALPHGQARLRVHAVGQPDLQRLRLAAALLPPPGRLRVELPGADGATAWERYGRQSGNEKCRDCMVHCGFEATAVHQTFSSLGRSGTRWWPP